MRALALTTDAYGGHGGIAQYNRDFFTALASHPAIDELVVLARTQAHPTGPLPPKVTFASGAARGKLAFLGEALRAAERTRFDVMICGHLNLLPIAWPLALLRRAPILLMIYGVEAWKPFRGAFGARFVDKVDATVSISAVTLERFRGWARPRGDKSFVLPNAFDPAGYGPGPKPADLVAKYGLAGKRVILTFGRMDANERYKGFDEVLEVLPSLPADVSYLCAGDGSDRPRLEDKARALGLGGRVVFTGRVEEARKADVYRLADAFVMPGRGEGFGFVFLEAMACGIPVVASSIDGSREAVRQGELGLLVHPDDKDAIRAATLEALGRGRGPVPAGLEYFTYPNFERRAHEFVAAMGWGAGKRRAA